MRPCTWSGMAPGVWGEPFCMKAYAALHSSGTSGQYAIPQNPSVTLPCCVLSLFAFSRNSLLNQALRLLLFLKPNRVATSQWAGEVCL